MLSQLKIQANSCLFLDRDGVINERLMNEYVRNWSEFNFLDGVFEALIILQKHFKIIVIVTNQQGVGKGLQTIDELHIIHNNMLLEFEKNNIKIDAVFFAPQLKSENSMMRKPAIGMALKAKQLFNHIELKNSIMVGDTISDMQFGKNAAMKTVFISNDEMLFESNKNLVDFRFDSLLSFAKKFE